MIDDLQTRARLLERVARAWLDEDRLTPVLPALCERSELSPEMVRWGLREALTRWTCEAFLELARRELGPPAEHTLTLLPRRLGVVLAGTVPPAGMLAVALPLLTGAHVRVRPSRRVAPLIQAFAESLTELAPELGARCDLHHGEPTPDAMRAFTRGLDALVVHGADATLARWRAHAPRAALFVGRGHRVSAAYLDADAAATEETLRGFAWDLCAWDQTGCLSPLVLYIEAPHDPRAIAERMLRHALPPVAERLPPGAWSIEARARRTTFIRSQLLDAEHLRGDRADLLVYDQAAPLGPHCLHRVLQLRPVEDDAALIRALTASASPLQGLAVASPERREALARALAHHGLSRVCAPGHLQRPPLSWSHDGQGELRALLRRVDLR